MNQRERYIATLLFQDPDRIPFMPGAPRESTLAVWRGQGMPDCADYLEALVGELGLEKKEILPRRPVLSPGVSFRLNPCFEEKILEHKDGHYIVLDWMGAVTEISDEYDLSYLREAKDFVTRKWHRFPAQRAGFEGSRRAS